MQHEGNTCSLKGSMKGNRCSKKCISCSIKRNRCNMQGNRCSVKSNKCNMQGSRCSSTMAPDLSCGFNSCMTRVISHAAPLMRPRESLCWMGQMQKLISNNLHCPRRKRQRNCCHPVIKSMFWDWKEHLMFTHTHVNPAIDAYATSMTGSGVCVCV